METEERGQLKLMMFEVKSKKERWKQMKGRKHFCGSVVRFLHSAASPVL